MIPMKSEGYKHGLLSLSIYPVCIQSPEILLPICVTRHLLRRQNKLNKDLFGDFTARNDKAKTTGVSYYSSN